MLMRVGGRDLGQGREEMFSYLTVAINSSQVAKIWSAVQFSLARFGMVRPLQVRLHLLERQYNYMKMRE